jgi:hypothetical protein
MLQEVLLNEDHESEHEYLQPLTSDGDGDTKIVEDEEATPCPTKKEDQHFGSEYSDVEQDEQFQTPLMLKKPKNKPQFVIDLDNSSLSEMLEDKLDKAREKSKGKKKAVVKDKDSRKRAKVYATNDSTCL